MFGIYNLKKIIYEFLFKKLKFKNIIMIKFFINIKRQKKFSK